MDDFVIRAIKETDRSQIRAILTEHWGSSIIVSRGVIHEADKLPGFTAEENGRLVGLITYEIKGKGCEIVSLNSFRDKLGIASALIEKVKNIAGDAGCGKLWLITTNDNLKAVGFYQKRGFRLRAIYPDAIEKSRRLKPEIPKIGCEGIPILDEIELVVDIK